MQAETRAPAAVESRAMSQKRRCEDSGIHILMGVAERGGCYCASCLKDGRVTGKPAVLCEIMRSAGLLAGAVRRGVSTVSQLKELFLARLAYEPAVLVQVTATEGSVPREAGTWMGVFAEAVTGTIGGGHLEYQALAMARARLQGAATLCRGAGARAAEGD